MLRVTIFSLEVSEPTFFFQLSLTILLSRLGRMGSKKLWRESCWLVKKEGCFYCKYKATFQPDGCAEPTSAATRFIHFGIGCLLDNIRLVEKRKILYFGLARNLIQHWISPNQDELSYSARTFISGEQIGWAAKPSLFGLRRRLEQTFVWPSLLSDAF